MSTSRSGAPAINWDVESHLGLDGASSADASCTGSVPAPATTTAPAVCASLEGAELQLEQRHLGIVGRNIGELYESLNG